MRVDKVQKAILVALSEKSPRPTADDLARVSRETGLTSGWIKRWIWRHKSNSKPKKKPQESNSVGHKHTVSGRSDPFRVEAFKYDSRATPGGGSSLSKDALPRPHSAPGSYISFQTSTSTSISPSSEHGRAYTHSPSLGYIPMTWPFKSYTSTTQGGGMECTRNSYLALGEEQPCPELDASLSQSQSFSSHDCLDPLPSVPSLDLVENASPPDALDPLQTSASRSIRDLLIEAENTCLPVFRQNTFPLLPELSRSNSVQSSFFRHLPSSMSFDPSTHSHSTSVYAYTQASHQSFPGPTAQIGAPQHGPLAYRTSLQDLTVYAKRIRSATAPDGGSEVLPLPVSTPMSVDRQTARYTYGIDLDEDERSEDGIEEVVTPDDELAGYSFGGIAGESGLFEEYDTLIFPEEREKGC
ncbi:hypothetical protein K474DRAFT_1768541 [Panus rudis PR-1116 ss-1]|nr:hypothetical protein K474DRAFT_1768541 [Panus rudis PR-1116 ss-1]